MKNNLLEKYIANQCTEEERFLVESWFENFDNRNELTEEKLALAVSSLDSKISIRKQGSKSDNVRSIKFLSVAAALLLLVGVSLLIFRFYNQSDDVHIVLEKPYYAPKDNNAVVILKDGSEFDLSQMKPGDTLRTEEALITQLADGTLHYLPLEGASIVYNTLVTKAGGTASVTLSDGSKVWLNANSKLRYPIAFIGDKREIEIQGEGYFEVAKDIEGKKPFYVAVEDKVIRVLGTEFNVNGFDVKNLNIALIGGSIELSEPNIESKIILQKGQVFDGNKVVYDENIYRHLDWKDGFFDLNNISIQELSEKLSNWYGVKINVELSVRNRILFGRVNRNKSIQEVLELVKAASNLDYKINNNTIYIFNT